MNINELSVTNYDAHTQTFTVEIPVDHLNDPVMLNLMYDPILSPSGSTIHRASYLRSLLENNQDPLTREVVSPSQLVKNPLLREINFSLVNQFPRFDNTALSDANDYIKEKTGHGIAWFKHRHLFFRGRHGLYRLLKFADTFKVNTQSLDIERRKFVREHKGLRSQFKITNWDANQSKCRVEIPLSALICAETKKIVMDPVTSDNNKNYSKSKIPAGTKSAPNNFLKALCQKIFLTMPQLDIYHPYDLIAYAMEHNETPLLTAAVAQFPQKINDAVNYQPKKSQTALMFAIEKKKTESIRILLASPEIDLKVADSQGWTALDYAKAGGDVESIQKLVFPLLIEGLLKNAQKYKGRGQKISEGIKNAWIDYQHLLLLEFKKALNTLIETEKFSEARELLSLANTTTNYFHQLLNVFPTPIKLRFSLKPLKLSRKTEAGEALKIFIAEKEEQLTTALTTHL